MVAQNVPVIEAFRKLEHVGLAQYRFVWGNHDAYLMDGHLTRELDLPVRQPYFTALDGNLFCEHGHRFDSLNSDNEVSSAAGPNLAYFIPSLRSFESQGRKALRQSNERACYLTGAAHEHQEVPFSIYVMGHTHSREMLRFNFQAEAKNKKVLG